ncbi:MAG: Ribosomal RNA large subunit methyltransferase J [Sodalis sp.]|nr:MAG: Ribosomal RNA large subunit methyltransferase J [Sodalis sp.]
MTASALNTRIIRSQVDIKPMLSYRRSFHTGNHADVLKHTALSLIMSAMKEKEKSFLYLDSHAGAGRPDLAT